MNVAYVRLRGLFRSKVCVNPRKRMFRAPAFKTSVFLCNCAGLESSFGFYVQNMRLLNSRGKVNHVEV